MEKRRGAGKAAGETTEKNFGGGSQASSNFFEAVFLRRLLSPLFCICFLTPGSIFAGSLHPSQAFGFVVLDSNQRCGSV